MMQPHSLNPDEPFTCEEHRGAEKSALSAMVCLVVCAKCSERARYIIETVGDRSTEILGAMLDKVEP